MRGSVQSREEKEGHWRDSRVAETTVPEGNYLVYLAANERTEANALRASFW